MTGPFDAIALDHLSSDEIYRLLTAENSPWTPQDGVAALQHQLQATLAPDLLSTPGMTSMRLKSLLGDGGEGRTFINELLCARPSRELLEAIKHFGRHCRHLPESPLYGAPAAVLYYAAIASARVRLGESLSTMPELEMQTAFAWASTYEGAADLSSLFHCAIARLQ
jgi:hypothetical protein